MDVIPVLDLAGGVAVHARAGDRSRYQPVRSALLPQRTGDPLDLLRAFRTVLGARRCYLADLDAIRGGPMQRALLTELAQVEAGFAGALLVDAGTGAAESAADVVACGASEVVVGLETLRRFEDLRAIVERVRPVPVLFSLDLHDGIPLVHPLAGDQVGSCLGPLDLAARALEAGAHGLLLLDLARVGTGSGVDLLLLRRLRRSFGVTCLMAGGGVYSREDLSRLRDSGCDGALVATAVHAGQITGADLAAFLDPPRPAR